MTSAKLHHLRLGEVLPSGMTVPGKVMDREVSRQTYSFWRYMGWSPLTDKATRHACAAGYQGWGLLHSQTVRAGRLVGITTTLG